MFALAKSCNIRVLVIFFLLGSFCSFSEVTFGESVVRVGRDNFLEVNGEPVFVIGAYGLPKGFSMEDGKTMGFNLIHSSAKREEWDKAQELGLYVWSSFGSRLDFDSGNQTEKEQGVERIVKALREHPALLFWESMDEPAWTNKAPAKARATAEGLTKGYQFLKQLDPNHPVYLNHAPRNMVETLQKYSTACDIVCADIYPILDPDMKTTYAITPDGRHGDLPNQTPSCVGEYVDKMKEVAFDNQPVFLVLQGFSWEYTREANNRNPEHVIFPSYAQSRFMAYNAIIHGANGLMYWGLHTVPGEHEFVKNLSRVLNEINALAPVLLSPTLANDMELRYHERGSTIAAGIEILCKEAPDGIYLIAANTGIDPAAADFTNLPVELGAAEYLTVLGEDRRVAVKDGSFFDEFEGLGVHVYMFKKD